MKPQINYPEYEKQIKSIARKFSGKNKIIFDELVSEGNLGLIEAADSFKDDKKTKFQTWAYSCIYFKIKNYLKEEKRKINTFNSNKKDLEEFNNTWSSSAFDSERAYSFFISMNQKLSENAKIIINMVFNSDFEFYQMIIEEKDPPRITIISIKKFLLRKGWAVKDIEATFVEIKQFMKETK